MSCTTALKATHTALTHTVFVTVSHMATPSLKRLEKGNLTVFPKVEGWEAEVNKVHWMNSTNVGQQSSVGPAQVSYLVSFLLYLSALRVGNDPGDGSTREGPREDPHSLNFGFSSA